MILIKCYFNYLLKDKFGEPKSQYAVKHYFLLSRALLAYMMRNCIKALNVSIKKLLPMPNVDSGAERFLTKSNLKSDKTDFEIGV